MKETQISITRRGRMWDDWRVGGCEQPGDCSVLASRCSQYRTDWVTIQCSAAAETVWEPATTMLTAVCPAIRESGPQCQPRLDILADCPADTALASGVFSDHCPPIDPLCTNFSDLLYLNAGLSALLSALYWLFVTDQLLEYRVHYSHYWLIQLFASKLFLNCPLNFNPRLFI